MRDSNNMIKRVDRAIGARKPNNIHTEDLGLCIKSTLSYFLFYRYKNKPHHELRELLQAFSSSFMIQDVYENLEEIVDGISHTISKIFNAFLIIELIPATDGQEIEIYSLYDEKDIAINILKKALEDLEINDLSVFIKQEDKSLVKPL